MQKSSLYAWVLLIVLSLIWGSSFILIKKGLIALSPEEVGSLRIAAASLFLFPAAWKRLKDVDKKNYLHLLFAGLLGSLIPAFLFAVAQTHLESAITGVLNGLVPIFTILIGLFLLRQQQPRKVYVGVFIGFIGTFILITAGEGGSSLSRINEYSLLVILASLCYASNLNLIKEKLNTIHPLAVTSISLIFVGPMALIYLMFFTDFVGHIYHSPDSRVSALYIIVLGVLGTAVALIIFNKILQMKDALFASSVTYIIPIVAVGWGILDGERIYLLHYLGMVAVGIGVYIANTNKASHKK